MPSGSVYQVETSGNGKQPSESSECLVAYTMQSIDGKVIDQGESRWVFNLLIEGLKETLLSMKEGDKWTVYIPSSAGFGDNGMEKTPPHSTLIWQIELKKVYDGKR